MYKRQTLGPGVLLSAASIGVIQGVISGIAMLLGDSLGEVSRSTPWVVELTATGGGLIMGISLILLELKQVRVANLLPAVAIAPLIVLGLQALHIGF